ncbi:hypothetical protein GCM10027297_01110 [Parahaliea aestuarii]
MAGAGFLALPANPVPATFPSGHEGSGVLLLPRVVLFCDIRFELFFGVSTSMGYTSFIIQRND